MKNLMFRVCAFVLGIIFFANTVILLISVFFNTDSWQENLSIIVSIYLVFLCMRYAFTGKSNSFRFFKRS